MTCRPSLRLTIRTTSSPERRVYGATPPFEEAVDESLSPERRLVKGNGLSLFRRRLRCLGSERSRGGLDSRLWAGPSTSLERLGEEPVREGEEPALQLLTGSFFQCGPGLVEREDWALDDLL